MTLVAGETSAADFLGFAKCLALPARVGVGLVLMATLVLSGCGGSGGNGTSGTPPLTGTTQVTVAISSTANDRLAEYDASIQGITLTSQSGKTVTLLATTQQAEFVHVNGTIEPILTATVPQDIYVAADVGIGSTAITCLTQSSSGSLIVSTFANQGTSPATVTLPQPITVTGTQLGLTLNMQVAQSVQFSNCAGGAGSTFSFTPTFELSAFALPASAPTDHAVLGTLNGEVTAVDAASGSLQLTLDALSAPATPLTINSNTNTLSQGFAGLGALVVGQFVQVDGNLQADGSVLAGRIALADPVAVDVQEGPILMVDSAVPYLQMYALMEQGKDQRLDSETVDFANANFHIGGGFTNLASLPFTPSFTAADMVAGQNVYISTPTFNYLAPPDYNAVASTITLEPQTLNGTIVATSTSGSFTVYSVQLAPYDLFPALAQQAGQTTLLQNPGVVQVYVDANTQQLSATPTADGAVLRFYGLVFDDGGTLRMDCVRVTDGVTP